MINAVKSLIKSPIAYHADLAKMLRSVPAAVMLSQGMYWQEKAEAKDEEWFWTTAEEWFRQTGLTEESQATARKILKRAGVWSEAKKGLPAKLYFRVNSDVLIRRLEAYLTEGLPAVTPSANKGRYRKQEPGESITKFPVLPETVARQNRKQEAGNTGNKKSNLREYEGTNVKGIQVPQNEFAATNPEQPPIPKREKKKKTSPNSGAPPPKIPAWTSKVKDLFDRVNEEESQSAKVEHIPYETTAAPGKDFAAFKALRTCIEKKIGTDPEETVLLSSFEYLFRYGFRYLHSIALSKGGAIQYSPLTIQHSYNQIRQYAASFNRKPADPIKDLAATFIAEHRAKVSGQI
jgi:hypothetical protein